MSHSKSAWFYLLCVIVLSATFGYMAGRVMTHIEYKYLYSPQKNSIEIIEEEIPLLVVESIENNIMKGYGSGAIIRFGVGNTTVDFNDEYRFEVDVKNIVNILEVPVPAGMNYVASKKGKRFYSVTSKSGEKIKPENRIYFVTKEEAIAAGYY